MKPSKKFKKSIKKTVKKIIKRASSHSKTRVSKKPIKSSPKQKLTKKSSSKQKSTKQNSSKQSSTGIRLQKRISDSGYCSRRRAESLMEAGKVKVNGKTVTKMGTKVEESDKLEVSGTKLKFSAEHITVMMHKPSGFLTSRKDPHHKDTVMNLLPTELKHLKPAGRLDKESEGLLILSSDGALIQKLTHPSGGHTKTYEIIVKGRASDEDLKALRTGRLKLGEYKLNPMEFKIQKLAKGRKTWVEIILTEGRNRQIRRVMDLLGFPVIYLRRIKVGKLGLGKLEKNEYRILKESDIEKALS